MTGRKISCFPARFLASLLAVASLLLGLPNAGQAVATGAIAVSAVEPPAPAWPSRGPSPIQPKNRSAPVAGESNGAMNPAALITVEGGCSLSRAAAPSLAKLFASARSGGVALIARDCYRPYEAQAAAKTTACAGGNCACSGGAGHSIHGWGKAVDFGDSSGKVNSFDSPGYKWLKREGARFGWNHPAWAEPGGSACPEPWHWEWVGDGGSMHAGQLRIDTVSVSSVRPGGFWTLTGSGSIARFGDAPPCGSVGDLRPDRLVVSGTFTPDTRGCWLAAPDGKVFAFGAAKDLGSGHPKAGATITALQGTHSGKGYWLAASNGDVFAFGDAGNFAPAEIPKTDGSVVGMKATPSGAGYWLVTSKGQVLAFGDAPSLSAPLSSLGAIVGIESTPSGKGYWLVSSKGDVFAFGDAYSLRPLGWSGRADDIVGIVSSATGLGYWLARSDGAVLAAGDAPTK